MNIEIRRNRTITATFDMEKNKEFVEKMMENLPQITEEQRKIMDNAERNRHELEEKIWAYLEEHPENDLDGNPIKRETHEIGFEYEDKEVDGLMYGYAKSIYVRPKKSEYDKED